MKAIQKIVKNGSSAQVTIIRDFLLQMGLRPGDYVEVELDDHKELRIRGWINRDNGRGRGPGIIGAEAPQVPR